jgi:hypothetical protein
MENSVKIGIRNWEELKKFKKSFEKFRKVFTILIKFRKV